MKGLRICIVMMALSLLIVHSVQAGKKWTIMVYMNADNNLEPDGIDDFLEMAEVGSNDEIDIIVQMDRAEGYNDSYDNWTTCRRFRITKDLTPADNNELSDLGECNMADSDTLKEFIEWAAKNYPAPNYALIMWDHGDGWRSLDNNMQTADDSLVKINKKTSIRSAGNDENPDDELFIDELEQAIKGAGIKFKVIDFDECLMDMIEVAYEIKDYTDVMVASEEEEPGGGLPYNEVLQELANNPDYNATEFGKIFVNAFENEYNTEADVTLAALDLTKLPDFIQALNDFVAVAQNDWSSVQTARASSHEFNAAGHIDLYQLIEDVRNNTSDTELETKCDEVMSQFKAMVLKEFHDSDRSFAHGLAIYFPERAKSNAGFDRFYLDQVHNFLQNNWDEFLLSYFNATAPELSVPLTQTQPVLDGVIDLANEWKNAKSLELSSSVKTYWMYDDKFLYIAIDNANDTSLDISDNVGIYFDSDHNHNWDTSYPPEEGLFTLTWDGAGLIKEFQAFWYDDASYLIGPEDAVATDAIEAMANDKSGHVQYELRIGLTSAPFKIENGKDIGLSIYVNNVSWPDNMTNSSAQASDPLFYGNLQLSNASSSVVYELTSGWNLLNIYLQPDVSDLKTLLNDVSYVSAWKWENNKWAVLLKDADTQAYAASKDFAVFSSLNAGEGFWLHMAGNSTLNLTGTEASNNTLTFVQGWNLVGLKVNEEKAIEDVVPDGAISAWKWENNKWAVWLPDQETLQEYAASKDFITLQNIKPNEGFWVNVK